MIPRRLVNSSATSTLMNLAAYDARALFYFLLVRTIRRHPKSVAQGESLISAQLFLNKLSTA